MPILSSLRAVAASAVALAVAASAGVVLAQAPGQHEVAFAVPVEVEAAALARRDAEQRQALITSRAAEREALEASALQAVEQRATGLAETGEQIDATEQAVREAAEKAAAEQKAKEEAEQKAREEAAKPKGGTRAQNKELGRVLAQQLYGWGADQFACYDNIIMRESLWDQYADNPTSSAYGIPQALPGKKMASEGADWKTNPETQIRWGLKYVKDRYGTPCKAWSFKRAKGWY